MKYLLMSIGSRGDMEPLLAMGAILKQKGHEVVCVFPEQFRKQSEEIGASFRSLGPEFVDMLDSQAGRRAIGGEGTGLAKIWSYIQLARVSLPIQKKLLFLTRDIVEEEKPDRLLHNSKVIYAFLWQHKNPGKAIHECPIPYLIHPTKEHPHIGMGRDMGPFLNKLSYQLGNFALAQTIKRSAKSLGKEETLKYRDIKKALVSERMIFMISPSIFKRPKHWPANVQVLGFHERGKSSDWQASDELNRFLDKHKKILFITFGSMTNESPDEKTRILLDILKRNKIPAIFNTAAGGLVEPTGYDHELFHFVPSIPYDWILPKVYATIHHGGSGTTHLSLKYSCATMIIPHIIDQFLWNDLVHKLEAGPLGIPINKLKQSNLEDKILDLYKNQSYKDRAREIGERMRREDFKEELQEFLTSK